jgi:hypothetical protein
VPHQHHSIFFKNSAEKFVPSLMSHGHAQARAAMRGAMDPAPAVRPEVHKVLRQLEQIRPGTEGGTGPSEEGGTAHVPVACSASAGGDGE